LAAAVPADQTGATLARDDLGALVAYSLVSLVANEGSETPRVRLHPLVRELAREEWAQLPHAEQEAAVSAQLAGVQDWITKHPVTSPSTFQTLAPDEELIAGGLRAAAAHRFDCPRVIAVVEAWKQYVTLRSLGLQAQMGTLQLECAHLCL
jgi:hypothetical protein